MASPNEDPKNKSLRPFQNFNPGSFPKPKSSTNLSPNPSRKAISPPNTRPSSPPPAIPPQSRLKSPPPSLPPRDGAISPPKRTTLPPSRSISPSSSSKTLPNPPKKPHLPNPTSKPPPPPTPRPISPAISSKSIPDPPSKKIPEPPAKSLPTPPAKSLPTPPKKKESTSSLPTPPIRPKPISTVNSFPPPLPPRRDDDEIWNGHDNPPQDRPKILDKKERRKLHRSRSLGSIKKVSFADIPPSEVPSSTSSSTSMEVFNNSSSSKPQEEGESQVKKGWRQTLLFTQGILEKTKTEISKKKNEKKEAKERERAYYADENNRLNSFYKGLEKIWPHETPTPESLAAAGLYFKPKQNKKDRCMCYSCGAKLSFWLPVDDPKEEHRKWFPICEEVKSWGSLGAPPSPTIKSLSLANHSDKIKPPPTKTTEKKPSRPKTMLFGKKSESIPKLPKPKKEKKEKIPVTKKSSSSSKQDIVPLTPEELATWSLSQILKEIECVNASLEGLDKLIGFYNDSPDNTGEGAGAVRTAEKKIAEQTDYLAALNIAKQALITNGHASPDDWVEYQTEDGYPYWYNNNTGETTWETPFQFSRFLLLAHATISINKSL